VEITTWYTTASNGKLIPSTSPFKKTKKKISKPKTIKVKTPEKLAPSLQERVEARAPPVQIIKAPIPEKVHVEPAIIVPLSQEKLYVPPTNEFEVRTGKYDPFRRTVSKPSPTIGEMISKHNGNKVPYDPLRPATFDEPEKRYKQKVVPDFNTALAEVLEKLSPSYKQLAERVKDCQNNLWDKYKKSRKELGEENKESGEHGFLSKKFLEYAFGKAGKQNITSEDRHALYLELSGKGPERIFSLKQMQPLELRAMSKKYAGKTREISQDVTTD